MRRSHQLNGPSAHIRGRTAPLQVRGEGGAPLSAAVSAANPREASRGRPLKILYFFPRAAQEDIGLVQRGVVPSDRLYGLVELSRYGHRVDAADERFVGRWAPILRALRRRGLNACPPSTLRRLRGYDVAVVKDQFSPVLTLACRALGVPLVYLDAMFDLPRRRSTTLSVRGHLRLADGVIAYSRTQIALWAERVQVRPDKFHFLPYTIDLGFYRPVRPSAGVEPYVLSVGRDLGRRFSTLVEAMEGLGIRLKLVTRPYLLRDVNVAKPWIQVLDDLSYPELFQLYADAAAVVIPLKGGLSYPSGVRGMLEAMTLGKPVVATRTPVLEEYALDGQGVIYSEADNVGQLRTSLTRLFADGDLRARLAESGATLVRERYGMEVFARGLEAYLVGLCGKSADGRQD